MDHELTFNFSGLDFNKFRQRKMKVMILFHFRYKDIKKYLEK